MAIEPGNIQKSSLMYLHVPGLVLSASCYTTTQADAVISLPDKRNRPGEVARTTRKKETKDSKKRGNGYN